jgi:hypothetical protein
VSTLRAKGNRPNQDQHKKNRQDQLHCFTFLIQKFDSNEDRPSYYRRGLGEPIALPESHSRCCRRPNLLRERHVETLKELTTINAPSTLPHPLFPTQVLVFSRLSDLPKDRLLANQEMYIPLADKFKTIPYRRQHRWLSWLEYVRGYHQLPHPPEQGPCHSQPQEVQAFRNRSSICG